MRPAPPVELLEYFRDLGFEELWIEPVAGNGERSTGLSGPQAPERDSRVAREPGSPSAPPAGVVPGLDRPAKPRPAPDSLGAAERARALAALQQTASACRACRLAEGRHCVVFGSGNPDADLMLVGEGPGAEEDRSGLPFVGPAGALLTKIIEAIGSSRDQVYIANVVKCRPPQNRDPLPDEVLACRDFLREQVRLVQPRVIVALGRVAAQSLVGRVGSLGSFRGTWFSYEGVPLRVTYHPAALLRDAGYKRPTWEDMKLVRECLQDEPTSG